MAERWLRWRTGLSGQTGGSPRPPPGIRQQAHQKQRGCCCRVSDPLYPRSAARAPRPRIRFVLVFLTFGVLVISRYCRERRSFLEATEVEASGLSFEEAGERTLILAFAAGLVTIHEFERAVLLGEAAEGEISGGGGVERRGAGVRRLFGPVLPLDSDLVMKTGLLHADEAHLAPLAESHGFDERVFDGAEGMEGFLDGPDETAEMIEGFTFEEDGFGEYAVAEAVAGGDGLAFGGDGAAGFGSIDAGGFELPFGAGFGVSASGEGLKI